MKKQEIGFVLVQAKSTFKEVWDRISQNEFELPKNRISSFSQFFKEAYVAGREKAQEKKHETKRKPTSSAIESDSEDNESTDENEVKFYDTDNSEFSKGKKKEIPKGIDSFDEQDTFTPGLDMDSKDSAL